MRSPNVCRRTRGLNDTIHYLSLFFIILSIPLQEFFIEALKLGITKFYSVFAQAIYGAIFASFP